MYALGVAIIGSDHTDVVSESRVPLVVAAVLLSVPGTVLRPAIAAFGIAGVDVWLYSVTNERVAGGVGAVLLAVGLVRNRRLASGSLRRSRQHRIRTPRTESALVKCRPAEISGNE